MCPGWSNRLGTLTCEGIWGFPTGQLTKNRLCCSQNHPGEQFQALWHPGQGPWACTRPHGTECTPPGGHRLTRQTHKPDSTGIRGPGGRPGKISVVWGTEGRRFKFSQPDNKNHRSDDISGGSPGVLTVGSYSGGPAWELVGDFSQGTGRQRPPQ